MPRLVIGAGRVAGVYESGENLMDTYNGSGLIIGNTWFRKRNFFEYSWMSGGGG